MCKEFLREGESVEELLEGGLKIIQDKSLYRFTSDSVLLSRFAKGKTLRCLKCRKSCIR